MTYTTHGHHIPGTTDVLDEGGPLPKRARCGGVRICGQCKTEALAALPIDTGEAADLRADLNALANPHSIEVLPIEVFRPKYYTFPAMQFTGGYESFEDIKTWLKSHGHTCAFWEYFEKTNIEGDRYFENQVEFRNHVGNSSFLSPGDWLVLWISRWERSHNGPRPAEFKAFSKENFEEQMERATRTVATPWSEGEIQPELDIIRGIKSLRDPNLESRY